MNSSPESSGRNVNRNITINETKQKPKFINDHRSKSPETTNDLTESDFQFNQYLKRFSETSLGSNAVLSFNPKNLKNCKNGNFSLIF